MSNGRADTATADARRLSRSRPVLLILFTAAGLCYAAAGAIAQPQGDCGAASADAPTVESAPLPDQQTFGSIQVILLAPTQRRDETQFPNLLTRIEQFLKLGKLAALSDCVAEDKASDPRLLQIIPAGDTVFMRRPNLRDPLPDAERIAFQAIAMTRDPTAKISRLQELADRTEGVVRYRALLEIARVSLRQPAENTSGIAEGALKAALAIEPANEPQIWAADAHFLLAYLDHRSGQHARAREGLDRALSRDPQFLDAILLRIHLNLKGLAQAARLGRLQQCRALTGDTLVHFNHYARLAGSRLHFIRLATEAGTAQFVDRQISALFAGYSMLLGGDARRGREFLMAAADAAAHGNQCLASVRAEIHTLIEFANRQLARRQESK